MPSDPDLLRGSEGSDYRIHRPHTCIGTEDKRGLGRGSVDDIAKENLFNDSDGKLKERAPSENKTQDKDSGPEEKRVVNVIPLPPRKPTSHSTVAGQDQANSAAVSHRGAAGEKGSQGKTPHASKKGEPPVVPPLQIIAMDKTGKPELTSDASGRVRRVSEDRPKLDKSHSTPAYDIEEDGSASVASPTSVSERLSSARDSVSSTSSIGTPSKFLIAYDSKSSLRKCLLSIFWKMVSYYFPFFEFVLHALEQHYFLFSVLICLVSTFLSFFFFSLRSPTLTALYIKVLGHLTVVFGDCCYLTSYFENFFFYLFIFFF